MTRPGPQAIVVFGARGDLARRKLLPGLLRLERAGHLPEDYRVIGSGRHEPDGPWADEVRSRLSDDGAEVGDAAWERFGGRLSFTASSADDHARAVDTTRPLREAREAWTRHCERLYLEDLLRRYPDNLAAAARAAGVDRAYIYRLLWKHKLR